MAPKPTTDEVKFLFILFNMKGGSAGISWDAVAKVLDPDNPAKGSAVYMRYSRLKRRLEDEGITVPTVDGAGEGASGKFQLLVSHTLLHKHLSLRTYPPLSSFTTLVDISTEGKMPTEVKVQLHIGSILPQLGLYA